MRYSVDRPNKLTAEKVMLIRALRIYNSSLYSLQKLAGMFHVTYNAIWKAVSKLSWKHIPFPSEDEAKIIAEEYSRERWSR